MICRTAKQALPELLLEVFTQVVAYEMNMFETRQDADEEVLQMLQPDDGRIVKTFQR